MSINKKLNELISLLQAGPVLPGGIRRSFETCGQPNCSCKRVSDPKLHGPYNTLSFSLKEKSSSMSLSKQDALLAEEMTERFKKAKVLLNELGIAYVDAGRTNNIADLEVPELKHKKQHGKTHTEKNKSKNQSKKNEVNRMRIKNLENSLRRAQNKCNKLKKEKELLKEENKSLEKEATRISLLGKNKTISKKKETLDEIPKFFKYPVKTIMNSIQLVTRGLLSLRGVSYAFEVFKHWYKGEIPSHTVVQNWVLRIGLYLYQQKPEQREDWLLIADHTIEYGQKKCLLILGITLERLLKNNNKIRHEDVKVLVIDIEKKADAESVKNSFINIRDNIGIPLQVVSDGGSNLKRGIKDFIETLEENVIQTYDVTHQASLILKRQLDGNERWNEFVTKISHTKRCLVHTSLAFMAPRKPKEKARWLNLEMHLNWAYQAIVYGGRILTEQERKKYDERIVWIEDFKDDLDAWSNILAMTKLLQSEIKQNGLSSNSLNNLSERFKQNNINIDTTCSKEVNTQIEEYLKNETVNLKDAVMLGCSDIIESIFGKYKYFSAKSPMKEIGKSILTIPVFTSEITPELVLEAMGTVSIKQVAKWLKEKLGTSLYSRRKEFLAGT